MKKRWIGRSIMYAAFVFCIAIAGFYLGEPLAVQADSLCCVYPADCIKPGDDIEIEKSCCHPAYHQADCSQNATYYCTTGASCPN